MTIDQYLSTINKRYQSGISTEHSYRGDLQTLLKSLLPDISITNEPKRIAAGAPDYILTKREIPVGFIEAKDIGDDDLAGKKKNKEQFNRYKATRDPFIFTDYLRFLFYDDEQLHADIRIADIEDGTLIPNPQKFDEFRDLITDFSTQHGQTIRSASKLSKMMAGKARLLATIITNALQSDEEAVNRVSESANTTLREQLQAFQNVLIHDIDAKEFADIYAQTIAYGMFAARLNDTTLDTFSRHEAAELIPKTNPFLRKLFQYIAGYDLDDRIAWIVDALADIFRATDVAALLEDFGKATQQNDPIIHFYETFLAEFDPKLRKSRGVWYTPEPVVNFIVRAVDDILKDEFGLKDGLADTSKTTVKVNTDVKDQRSSTGYKQEEQEVHKVQILDPAAGTGTFLAEAVKQIHATFKGQQGLWPSYVENHLIPRLNGFELLMASYAMAHLKLDMLLRETGYDREAGQRFRVYLTNSLEEHHPDTGTLFAGWLSHEANEANHVKRDTPVMVVMGNPPYSVSSRNKGKWIQNLISDYKKNLDETTINSLSDDYVKFIRYGQHFVDQNGEGILAYISNNSFLDGLIHRRMRESLMNSFNKIYILDLHGDSNKNEKMPNGKKDENVFDIRQGVSISLFIKTDERSESKVLHSDLFGKRNKKYQDLIDHRINSLKWKELNCEPPYYFFTPKDFSLRKNYEQFVSIEELFKERISGIETKRDDLFIDLNKNELEKRIKKLIADNFDQSFKKKFKVKNSSGYDLIGRIKEAQFNSEYIRSISYRPFEEPNIYYDPKLLGRSMYSTMRNLLPGNNFGLVASKQCHRHFTFSFITDKIIDSNYLASAKKFGGGYVFPLYLYPEEGGQQKLEPNYAEASMGGGQPERRPNLNMEIVNDIADRLGLKFVPEKEDGVHLQGGLHLRESEAEDRKTDGPTHIDGGHQQDGLHQESFAPIDLLDYIYAVLHAPAYREKYKEFLKIDFPRVPYPSDAETFWQLVELGGELRRIHLLEHPVVDNFITTYPEAGSNKITKRLTKTQPGFIPDKENEPLESTSGVASNSKAKTSSDGGQPPDEEDGGHSKSGLHRTGPDHRYPNEPLGKVQINEKQYFGNVPRKAWNFYIGGYQPAEKWLKDRRGRTLSVEEIQHYQRIIVALMETDRIMQQIDEIEMA